MLLTPGELVLTLDEFVRLVILSHGPRVFIIMCGIPGSGKSTVAAAFEKIGAVLVTLEPAAELQMIAARKTGNQMWRESGVTWSIVRRKLARAVALSKPLIVADTLNTLRFARVQLAAIAGDEHTVVGIHMNTPWEQCRERLLVRDAGKSLSLCPDPEDSESMHRQLYSAENCPHPDEAPWYSLEAVDGEPELYRVTISTPW